MPFDFNNIIGYKKIIITCNKLIKNKTFPPIILFSGKEHIGKKLFVAKLSALFFCKQYNACGTCHNCTLIIKNQHPNIINLNCSETKISANEIKIIQEHLNISAYSNSTTKNSRLIILNDVDNISTSCINKLLITLESTANNCFILLTTSKPASLLPTLTSRCIKWHINPPAIIDIKEYLKKNKITEYEINKLIEKYSNTPGLILEHSKNKEEDLNNKNSFYLEILNSKYPAKILEKIEQTKFLSSNTLEKIINNIEHTINILYKHQIKYESKSNIIYSHIIKRRIKLRELKLYIYKKIHLNKNLSIEQIVFKQ
jgi:DNA polymerase III delta prime subunit